jgi:hypothetical protein
MGILYNTFRDVLHDMSQDSIGFFNQIESHRNNIVGNIHNIKTRLSNEKDTFYINVTTSAKKLADNIGIGCKSMTFLEFFNDMFDPHNNKVEKIDNISTMFTKRRAHEAWTDSDCLLVPNVIDRQKLITL